MAPLKACTPAQAKRVWQTMSNPSTRRVARKLHQSGTMISHMTVARWRSGGWRPLQDPSQHPLDVARDHLDDAVPVLTGDPMTTSTSFVQESAEREALELLTEDELLRRAAREVAQAVCVVARAVMMQPMVVMTKPAEFALLAQALSQCLRAATAVLAREPSGPA